MKRNIRDLLLPVIQQSLEGLGLQLPADFELYLDFPTDSRFGDLTTNVAMRLSKALNQPARQAAEMIIAAIRNNLEGKPFKEYIKEIKVEGAGFINFYLQEKYFFEHLQDIVKDGRDALKIDFGRGKNVLVEFVSANPTGSLSVAHARQAAVGDCLVSLLEFLGFCPKREYYLNDEGNQINILGQSVDLRMRELNGEKVEFPENCYQGEYIYDIAKKALAGNIPQQELGDFAAGYILDIIKRELADFGIRFDNWYSQKELTKAGKIEQAFAFLKSRDFLYEQDGALWFKSTAFGDDKDRVVIKSDGSYTYLAPDIAYHQEKYKRGFSWLINLWGPDHHGYINRLKASVAAFGHDKNSLSVIIVQLASIFREGKPVQMSTRRGEYITLREVLNEVGVDAARFFFIMRRTSSHLDFDLAIAKKQTAENPVYYVQYAHARICSILRGSQRKLDPVEIDLHLLKEKEELALVRKISFFSAVLNICLNTVDPYMVTVYLQELSECFHKFYDKHRVLGDDEQLSAARLVLIDATRIVIAAGLELLGISRPEKM